MPAFRFTELEYATDSALRFQALLGRLGCVFLDSGGVGGQDGRYDILSAEPYASLTTRGALTEIVSAGGVELSERDPLELLRERLAPPPAGAAGRRPRLSRANGDGTMPTRPSGAARGSIHSDRHPLVPFYGGALGYFGYDLGRRFERMPSIAAADVDMPDMAVGLYDWAVVTDHRARRCWLVGTGRDERTFDEWDALLERVQAPVRPPSEPFEVLSGVDSSFDRAGYAAAFRRIKTHIRRGDCYQVNLTQRFEAAVRGHPWHAYRTLRELNPAPFSAYLGFPDGAVLSSSPERFLRVRDGQVETKPIKGTRPRSADPKRDGALAEALRSSAKDRAENVMIVDLLRNDLGKCCEPGSVRVSKLFEIESFASVHHLVSTIEAKLRPDSHALDLLRAAFPGGSITGAPKLRAMQIIEALEPQRRGVYCGCIGYVGFDGSMDLNIAIRTIVQRGGRIYAWAGGGIVADSEVEAEYQESFDKAAALLEVLNERKRDVAS
ncbi:MAG TPA: aminodeoxychorismate synthase component I [Gammaproteobacteria bacterium]|nr:aminodeoxychorismate synthase component I [Gammaproteobacteria bacterium]